MVSGLPGGLEQGLFVVISPLGVIENGSLGVCLLSFYILVYGGLNIWIDVSGLKALFGFIFLMLFL